MSDSKSKRSEENVFFFRYFQTSRIDKRCLSAFTIESIMTTARKSNIRKRKDTRDVKKKIRKKRKHFARNPNMAAISFILKVASVEWLPTVMLKICHGKSMKTSYERNFHRTLNHVRKCMWPCQFRTFITFSPNTTFFFVDVIWFAINWEGTSVSLTFVFI